MKKVQQLREIKEEENGGQQQKQEGEIVQILHPGKSRTRDIKKKKNNNNNKPNFYKGIREQ